MIQLHGFSVDCELGTEPQSESIAIYAKDGEWTHLSKYKNGQWLSKIGEDHDIAHASLDSLEGELYGKVALILSRPI